MLYDTVIRHTRRVPRGDGFEHSFEFRHVEAMSEEEAFLKVKHNSDDHIACIDSHHHVGLMPFSVATGEPEFYTDAQRPPFKVTGSEPRVG